MKMINFRIVDILANKLKNGNNNVIVNRALFDHRGYSIYDLDGSSNGQATSIFTLEIMIVDRGYNMKAGEEHYRVELGGGNISTVIYEMIKSSKYITHVDEMIRSNNNKYIIKINIEDIMSFSYEILDIINGIDPTVLSLFNI